MRRSQGAAAPGQHGRKAGRPPAHLRPGPRQQLLSHVGDLDGAIIAHHEAAGGTKCSAGSQAKGAERQCSREDKLTVCRNHCMR